MISMLIEPVWLFIRTKDIRDGSAVVSRLETLRLDRRINSSPYTNKRRDRERPKCDKYHIEIEDPELNIYLRLEIIRDDLIQAMSLADQTVIDFTIRENS
jgi:hypothetical protein